MEKPKGIAALIIAKEKGSSKSDSFEDSEKKAIEADEQAEYTDEENEGGDSMGLAACGEDLISAIKTGDAAGVVSALRHFIEIYGGGSSE